VKNKVYIITPSYRAKNLHIIKKSINFNKIHKWIIIYDIKHLKIKKKLFEDNKHIIELFHKDPESVSGNSQRNFALDYLDKKKNKNLFIYYLDDDNNIHKNFYEIINKVAKKKIYTFDQLRKSKMYFNGKFQYIKILKGNIIKKGVIDSAMFLADFSLINTVRWNKKKYEADGEYIVKCFLKNKKAHEYISQTSSYYNYFDKKLPQSYKNKIKNKFLNFFK
tara:strand:- start:785 stop:1447 length:663 start_codon:yes stop_codon:yes gene_type:complete